MTKMIETENFEFVSEPREPIGWIGLLNELKMRREVRTVFKWTKITDKMLNMEESYLMLAYLITRANDKYGTNLVLTFKNHIEPHQNALFPLTYKQIATEPNKQIWEVPEDWPK